MKLLRGVERWIESLSLSVRSNGCPTRGGLLRTRGGGNLGNQNFQDREERELRSRLMGQQQQREGGGWQQVDRRGGDRSWQGERNRDGDAWEGGDR